MQSNEININFITQELLKCKSSAKYFINEYCHIEHPIKGIIPFKLWDFQKDVITNFSEKRFVILLKSRQIGISTLVAAYAVWLCIFNKNKKVLIIATKSDTAQNLIKKVEIIVKNLPIWLKPKLLDDNKHTKSFKNGAIIKAIPTTDDAGRSESLSLLVIDECISGDTFITIKNKTTNEIKRIKILDLIVDDIYK